ncbi:MAG: hypothetical protein GEU75_03545 [Dehalococcoidia bacterium]|nr:hypothetical protein [Dehalococcoidia bacterium]
MLFNVSGLMQEGIGATRRHSVQGTLTSEEHGPERLSGDIELLRTKDGVLVRAHLNLVDPETCSRCLKPLEETLQIDFEEEFQATLDLRSGQVVREPLDPDAFTIDEHHMLDLTEAVRQYREASAEMQPLCKPDCRGLCPNCGRDLNAGGCDCNSGPVDNRWAGLAELLGEGGEQKDRPPSGGASGGGGTMGRGRRSRPKMAYSRRGKD